MIKSSDYITATGGADFYKCASVDTTNHTWTGYKLTPNADNGYSLASTASSVGEYYIMPTVDGIYDPTGKLELKSYYGGDNYDPYGDGLLYSIFINGGTGVSAPSYGAVTTDNYTYNVETVDGVVARKFNGSEIVSATAGVQRTIWSYSVWLRNVSGEGTPISYKDTGLIGIGFYTTDQVWFYYGNGSSIYHTNITNGQWHHYVITYANSAGKIYIDGSLMSTYMQDVGSHSSMKFGTGNSAISNYNGYIANFRFYDHVLTSSEIAALYAELTPSNS